MDNDLENIRNKVTEFCNERGYSLAPESEKILRDIVNMKEIAGEYYCPCRKERSPDTICVCRPVHNGLVDVMGSCFCNLIVAQSTEGGSSMSEAAKVITDRRYSQGFTYEKYFNQLGDTRERFAEQSAAFHLAASDAQFFKGLVQRIGGLKVLAIVEDWCPDVHRGLPVIDTIAKASGMELRVFPRDKNPDIMNLYLKQGKFMSIPVFAFFDRNLNPLGHWIERPEVASRFMEEVATELAKKKLSEEEIRQERRKRSASMGEDWRQATVKELKDLLAKFRV